MPRKALGKGIEALIPATPDQAGDSSTSIPIKLIAENPYQPRKVSGQEVAELAASIAEHGLLQPILVRKKGSAYQLVAGSRRLKAAQIAGLKQVPVLIREADDRQMLALALVENLQREDLNPIESALAYKQLTEEFSMTQQEVARVVGKDRTTVTNTLRLLTLPRKARLYLQEGKITEGHARALLAISSATLAEKLCDRIHTEGLSVRTVEKLVREYARVKIPQRAKKQDGILLAAEEFISEKLGVRTAISRGRRGGRITIHFASEKELDRLLEWFKKK